MMIKSNIKTQFKFSGGKASTLIRIPITRDFELREGDVVILDSMSKDSIKIERKPVKPLPAPFKNYPDG